MTAVILTPTHIASDHCRVSMDSDNVTIVDKLHPKIFIDHRKRFILGMQGTFFPEVITTPESMDKIYLIVRHIEEQLTHQNLTKTFVEVDNPNILEIAKEFFSEDVRYVIVTKRKRFGVKVEEDGSKIVAAMAGSYLGLGSGGHLAEGLLLSGLSIYDIWKPLSLMDELCSEEHTIVDLSILEDQSE